jgi:hypothetical protein
MNPREYFIDTIKTALERIQIPYGYNNDVKQVLKGEVAINLVNKYPTLWIDIADEQEENDIEKVNEYTNKLIIVIGCIVKSDKTDITAIGTLTDKINSIVGDVKDCLKQFKTNSIDFSEFPLEVIYKTTRTSSPLTFINNADVREIQIQYELTYKDFQGVTNIINAEAPDAPIISSPANGSSVTTINPSINWNTVSGAVYYEVEISENSSFGGTSRIKQDFIQTSSYTVPTDSSLDNTTTYYVRVRSANNVGYSNWSSSIGFTVNSSSITPLDWNEISGAISWWNTYSTTGMTISSGISALLDQIGSRKLTQGTSTRRPALSGNAWGSLSSAFFNPLTATESYVLGYNDTTAVFDWSNTSTGTFMFVMKADGYYFDNLSQYNCAFARTNTSFGGQMAFIRGVNTGPIGYTYAYPGTSGDYMTIPCATGVPHQIVVTHSGSAHTVWIDGAKLYDNKRYSNLTITNNIGTFLNMGAFYNDAVNHGSGKYVGHIFEAGFATASLTSGQIAALYEKFKQRFNL